MGTKSSHSPRAARRGRTRNRPSSSRSSSRPARPAAPAAPATLAVNGEELAKAARAESLEVKRVEVQSVPIARRFYDCPRCANSHDTLELKRLTRPAEGFSHFAMCPNLGEPILLTVAGA